MAREFTLTEEHLKLLENACVGWQDCETGAPEIDPKRPYGNSSVWLDVAEILGKPLPEDGDESASGQHLERSTREECERLHRETETALEIVLTTRSFLPGRYVLANEYGPGVRWQRVTP